DPPLLLLIVDGKEEYEVETILFSRKRRNRIRGKATKTQHLWKNALQNWCTFFISVSLTSHGLSSSLIFQT
ncbi:hypothetical protein E2320_021550, partial [Naja naja]